MASIPKKTIDHLSTFSWISSSKENGRKTLGQYDSAKHWSDEDIRRDEGGAGPFVQVASYRLVFHIGNELDVWLHAKDGNWKVKRTLTRVDALILLNPFSRDPKIGVLSRRLADRKV